MRNLQLLYQTNAKVEESGKILVINGNGSGDVYICTEENLFCYDPRTDSTKMLCEISGTISCEHLVLNDSICIATKLGEVNVFNLTTNELEEVTYCEGGIEKMSWSPDQEIVVFVTKFLKVVVMTCMYDSINEEFLTEERFGEDEFITVGWGKKETQFHGSEGKQAAKQKASFVAPKETNELPQDVNISWRGDGEFFAVSFVGVFGRMFKVFDKEGQLRFTSEKLNDLTPHIAWKCSGSWIAVPQKFPNKSTIALFEKNGLRHREIVLPFNFSQETIENLSWSCDSDILSITTLQNSKNNLYLYTISNYHWYLKQFLSFNNRVADLKWDTSMNEEKTLHILLTDGSYIVYRWTFSTTNSNGNTSLNQAITNVIDGSNLLITDLRNTIIPPPMCGYKLETKAFINVTGFICNAINPEDHNKFFILNSNDELEFYNIKFEKNFQKNRLKAVQLTKVIKLSSLFSLNQNHILWLDNYNILFCVVEKSKTIVKLVKILEKSIEELSSILINESVSAMASVHRNQAFLQINSGQIYILKLENEKLILQNVFSLPTICESIKSFKSNNACNLVSLCKNHELFLNSTKICMDVTSFCLTKNYIVFTTLTKLVFIRLTDLKVVNERKIERGAKLITIVPSDSKTILQMPRGNLEAIDPRVLSLEIISDYLENLMYRDAMDMLRKQRINLNILCDHNLIMFFNNLDKFLEDISNPQWLNLFLTDLQNEDYTKTMYASNYPNSNSDKYPKNFEINYKVKIICEKLCKRMEEKDFEHFILPIITTFVKICDLDKALHVIWSVKKKENAMPEDTKTNLAEEALKYLLYLVDVNELFNVALGTYDFGLVLFVATKSQKDPREYIPFLNELKKYKGFYRQFKIDQHIKKLNRALENISKCGEEKFDEGLEFIQEHKLYRQALQLYQNQDENECFKKIALAFGDHLRSIGKFEEASIMYEQGGNMSQAILTSKHIFDWRRCLSLTSTLNNGNKNELKSIALSLLPALEENGKYEDAFEMVKYYVSDLDLALGLLVNGNFFGKAIRESKIGGSKSFELKIIPSLLKYKEVLSEKIHMDQTVFIKHIDRLITVRTIKDNKNSNIVDENDVDECDLLSDTTSMNSSRFTGSSTDTGKTFRSSKNRRKHERKLLSLKEGNPFEDIALIIFLYNHINKIMNQQLHIRDTCNSLTEISHIEDARYVQLQFKTLLNSIKDSLDVIWIPEMMTNHQYLTDPSFDYAQLRNEQRYSLLNPMMRFKPQLNFVHWELEMLK